MGTSQGQGQDSGEDVRRRSMLRSLAARFPTAESAICEIAALRAKLTLPMGVVHVISDVHGEDAKLRHVINNASGALRGLVEQVVGDRLSAREKQRFLAVLYYPRESINAFSREIVASGERLEWVQRTLTLQFEIVRVLRTTYRRDRFEALIPRTYRELFMELGNALRPAYIGEMIRGLAAHDRDWGAVRAAARLIRNLSIDELLVIGDLGDRGPRMDRVCDTLMRQPSVSLLWGNHDMLWVGAHLGHEPCMLTMLRFSARYRQAAQLEEGYGILTTPLERLVREVYADDPAEHFKPKGVGLRDERTVARMQKALAIMQFKSEGRMIERHPEWELDHRRLLHRIDLRAGTVTIGGVTHPLLDTRLPTIDPANPYAYSPEEQACVDRLRDSFTRSMRLREHMEWLVRHGGMWTRRDDVLMFHACVPVDGQGVPLSMRVDGREVAGRELMDALGSVVRRAMRKRWFGLDEDADWLWYLWGGPRSPLFGKDKLATFETYFLGDKSTHKETKNAYFDLMHDAAFIRKIGALFGCGEDVLVVNGHVPVKMEKGEEPLKRGGNAITIDGAFSAAYGDRGYTLVIRPDRIDLAHLAPFTGVESVVHEGADIEPGVGTVRRYPGARTIGETWHGREIRQDIENLETLVRAYQEGEVVERDDSSAGGAAAGS
ncbi:MAG: fructose-bisphosphatase class III [Planctomycetota bacterium]|nr:fructose-bisphosphatase class III [Planctomycetota bacterium]